MTLGHVKAPTAGHRSRLAIGGPWRLMVAVLISLGVGYGAYRGLVGNFSRTLSFESRRLNNDISEKLQARFANLTSMAAFFAANQDISEAEYDNFTEAMLGDHNSRRGVLWVEKVDAAERPAFEQRLLSRIDHLAVGAADQTRPGIFTIDQDERRHPASAQNTYFPILYARNAGIDDHYAGYDLASDRDLAPLLERAARSDDLVREIYRGRMAPDGVGIIVAAKAVFRPGMPRASLAERRAALRGFALSFIDAGSILYQALRRERSDIEAVKFIDTASGTGIGDTVFLAYCVPDGFQLAAGSEIPLPGGALWDAMTLALPLEGGLDNWALKLMPGSRWRYLILAESAFAALAGLSLILLGHRHLRNTKRAHHLLERRVRQRTRNMIEANRVLQTQREELMRMTWDLSEARDHAESASKVKSEFLAMMSHEIRTPINGVLGMVDLLSQTKLDDQQRNYVGTIRQSGDALRQLVNDILDISRLEAGRLTLADDAFHISDVINGAVDLLRPRAAAKGVLLTADLGGLLIDEVGGDALRLRQVLLNLVGNAVKFTDHGSIHIEARAVTKTGAIGAHFTITDTGVGIPEDRLTHIFEKFTQVDNSTSRRFEGTGLGLAIARQLVELMGGEIHVRSKAGYGSVFEFSAQFRLIELGAANDEQPKAKAAEPPPHPAEQPTRKLLIAEDNPINQLLLREMLRRDGHDVTVVGDGSAAVEAVRGGQFDAVLMDLHMPVMDGLTATQTIRALPDTRANIPIIAVSADVLQGNRERCLAAGMNDYVTKPIDMALLRQCLERHTDTQPSSRLHQHGKHAQ